MDDDDDDDEAMEAAEPVNHVRQCKGMPAVSLQVTNQD